MNIVRSIFCVLVLCCPIAMVLGAQPANGSKDQVLSAKLASAILENDVDKVREMLENGLSPETIIPKHLFQDLHINDRIESEAGHRYFFQSSSTPLALAAALHSDPEVITMLLEAGADPERAVFQRRSALLISAKCRGSIPVARVLLDHGAEVDTPDVGATTPLIAACINAHPVEYIRFLLETGADPNATMIGNKVTPLNSSARYHHNPTVIKLLLDYKADVHAKGSGTNTVIGAACGWNPNIEFIKVLIEAGGQINLPNSIGRTPVMFAALRNTPEVMLYLIDNGADLEHADDYGETPLSIAALTNEPGVAMALINAGAWIESRDINGATPLLKACKRDSLDMMIALLNAGANPLATDYRGDGVMEYAKLWNTTENVEQIENLIEEELSKVP